MDEFTEVQDEQWSIEDDLTAEWALQKIADETAEYERMCDLADAQIAVIKEKKEAAKKRFENNTSFFEGKLREYFAGVKHRTTKTTEKYALLSGELVMKKATRKPVVNDEALVEWLAANNMTDYIKTKQTPAWADFKKALDLSGAVATVKETGEIVDGVTFEDVPETFEVKLNKEKGGE